MADKIPTGTRLDSLSRLSSASGSAGAKPGLKFKPKVVARRTQEERAADAPIDRPTGKPTQKPRTNGANKPRNNVRGNRGMQGTHLVQAGPLASSIIESTTQASRSIAKTNSSATPGFVSRLAKREPTPGRENSPDLDSDDDYDDLTKINMSEEYRFSKEESELFPVRAPRSDHEVKKEVMITREQTPMDDIEVKDEPMGDLDSILKQREDDVQKKLSNIQIEAVDDIDADNDEKILNDHKTIVKEILEIDNKEDQFMLFQLPRMLPEFADPYESIKQETEVQQKKVEGQIGKLRVHKSGKVTIKIGDVVMDVSRGAKTDFLQQIVLMDKGNHQSSLIGHLKDKIVVTPSFN